MENASKALLIAGAILLSILIISLGILVYNNAKNTASNQNLDKEEVRVFNSEWESYVGERCSLSEVRTMMNAVMAHNGSENKVGTKRTITINGVPPSGIPSSMINDKIYTISADYDPSTGLIINMNVNIEKSNGGNYNYNYYGNYGN